MTEELAEVLGRHRRQQIAEQVPGLEEGWVFPSRAGTLLYQSALTKPLQKAALEAGMARQVRDERGKLVVVGRVPSAHWFRYTLNDLLRRSATGHVQRAITGHVTEEMSEHYSHIGLPEKRAALTAALAPVSGDGTTSGDRAGDRAPDTKKAGQSEDSNRP
jgi:hypothetical protein